MVIVTLLLLWTYILVPDVESFMPPISFSHGVQWPGSTQATVYCCTVSRDHPSLKLSAGRGCGQVHKLRVAVKLLHAHRHTCTKGNPARVGLSALDELSLCLHQVEMGLVALCLHNLPYC